MTVIFNPSKEAPFLISLSCSFPNLECWVRVKSGNFGHQVNSDGDLVCFILKLLE